MTRLPIGQYLYAKKDHPIYLVKTDKGWIKDWINPKIAVIVDDGGGDFQTIQWIGGDPRHPNRMEHDTVAVRHIQSWFDLITEEEAKPHIPEDFVQQSYAKLMGWE